MPPFTTDTPGKQAGAEVEIEKLVYGGDGLARVDGQIVFVPFVVPGEKVQVRTERVKTGLLRAKELRVLEPSFSRTAPSCEYFTRCGGCHYQHFNYEMQLEQKQLILRETLRRLASIEYQEEIAVISGPPWNYRNRIQLHFSDGKSGFHQAGSHTICPIDHCPISSPLLVEAIAKLSGAVKAPQWPRFLHSMELFTNEEQLQLTIGDTDRPIAARFFEWCATFLPALAPGSINYNVAGYNFQISRGSFFQVNRFLVDSLVDEAMRGRSGQHAVDLYAGVGLFSLAMSKRFEQVQAIERGGPAFRDLEQNGGASPSLQAIKGSAEEFLRSLEVAPDLLLADPPRAGLGREITTEILRLLPQFLTIVSCDPATLSRDLKALQPAYGIERLAMADLFPQTYHFETVAHLQRQ